MKKIIKRIIKPFSTDENLARQEYILNLILLTTIILIGIGLIVSGIKLFFGDPTSYSQNSLSIILIGIILIFFIGLLTLSKRGHSRSATYLILISFFLLALKMGLRWGADLPAEILFYILVIVMSGILISGRISFFATLLCSIAFIITNYLHAQKIIIVDRSWISDIWGYSDIVVTSLIMLIIATISWLSNREMRRALIRANNSEYELKIERDNLELKVAEKTKELKIIQAEEIARVHRFAEFGRLSGGLFHDLVNPLTTVILNVGKIKEDHKNNCNLEDLDYDLDQALKASNRMGNFINAVRKQIKTPGQKELFNPKQEIEEAVSVLDYKAKHNKVIITLEAIKNIKLVGDPIKFNQIVTNLISNAIDSYQHEDEVSSRKILVSLTTQDNFIILRVKDYGVGINEDNILKIFEPFFSTKTDSGGLGLGLSLIKNLIEKDFNGEIEVISQLTRGSEFIVKIPMI
jgi:signal transduction histidine kinase